MTELKCPICERDMVFIESPDGFDVFVCTNSKCECCGYAGKNIWEYIADIKKKLDRAINAMESARDTLVIDCVIRGIQAKEHESYITLRKALEQINERTKGSK